MTRALKYYESYYRKYQPDVNYHVWQLQAFGRYYNCFGATTGDHIVLPVARQYVNELTMDLLSSRLWSCDLAKGPSFYPTISTLPVVCGLDSLMDVLWLANDEDERMLRIDESLLIDRAVRYLTWLQERSVNGGLGYGGWTNNEQRLDVSGHALSALSKVLWKDTAPSQPLPPG